MDSLGFYKNSLRNNHKKKRMLISDEEKFEKDFLIFENFKKTKDFLESELILTYISKSFEVDSKNLISYSLEIGKKVAVPLVIEKNTNLEFYFINSFKDLKLGKFAILEPVPALKNRCTKNQIENSLCVVPGLVFDLKGYRIGFGKGYYDRFLVNNKCKKIGLCYKFNLESSILRNEHDIPVDLIITEEEIILAKEGKKFEIK